MPKNRQIIYFITIILLTAYLLGLIGWVWDGLLHFIGGESLIPHQMMIVGLLFLIVFVVVFLILQELPAFWTSIYDQSRYRQSAPAWGGVVLFLGVLVDQWWHTMYPGVGGNNLLILPGHLIELGGWLIGGVITLSILQHTQ